MSDACYCDYEPNEFYSSDLRVARKQHKCSECRHLIEPGERYEYVAGKTDGDFWYGKTCARCLSLREWVTAHVPCFCWYHQTMLENADETMREYACEVPGMGMEYGRLRAAVRRAGEGRTDARA